MPLFGFALATVYGPNMVDGASAPRFAVMAIALPLLWTKSPRLTVGHALLACWLAWAAVSAAWSPDGWSAMQHLIYLAMGGLAFCLGGEAASLRAFGRGAALGLAISSALAIAQTLGYGGIWQGAPPSGLFYNKNFMAEALAIIFVLCMTYRDWVYAALLAPGLALAHCRSADLGLGLALLVWLWQTRRFWAFSGVAALGLAIATQLDAQTLGFRLIAWTATLSHLTLVGHGLGSFFSQYPDFGPLIQGARPEYPHNELVNAIYELGLGALAPFCLGLWCFAGEKRFRPVLCVCAAVAAFGFPLQLPFTLCAISLVAGHCSYSRRSLRYIATKWGGALHVRAEPAGA